jgi:uncharacterized membrane protein YjdF
METLRGCVMETLRAVGREWLSRKLWTSLAAGGFAVWFARWLQQEWILLLEKELLTPQIYSQLSSGTYMLMVIFMGAAAGMYTLSNVGLNWIHREKS